MNNKELIKKLDDYVKAQKTKGIFDVELTLLLSDLIDKIAKLSESVSQLESKLSGTVEKTDPDVVEEDEKVIKQFNDVKNSIISGYFGENK